MPKSAKKRRDKAADFTKSKLKLGKGKQLPSNAIDTSFKARSIVLPSQSIAHEKNDDAPTTKRQLSFDDLVSHTKHYSSSMRKDAIVGFRELLEANWELLDSYFTALINACVRLIGDEDASVRRALLTFFSWLLPRIPQSDIMPHAPLLLLFTTSAQTHIFPEIRIDAIRFLDLFLEHIPRAVTVGWDFNGHGSRVLEGYLGILNAGTKFGEADGPVQATSTASVVLTPASKLVVLHSLSMFLQTCLSNDIGLSTSASHHPPSSLLNTWFLLPSFARPGDYYSFEQIFQTSQSSTYNCCQWRENVDPEDNEDDFPGTFTAAETPILSDDFTLQKLADISDVTGSSEYDAVNDHKAELVARLARTLQSTLIATFLDCAPSVFMPSGNPSETQVQLVLAVGQIARTLYNVVLQASTSSKAKSTASDDLNTFLGYMTPYFPFSLLGTKDVKVEQAFQELNLIFSELTSLLVLTSNAEISRLTSRGKARQVNSLASGNKLYNSLSIQIERVSNYILQLLSGGPISGSQLGRTLTPAAYASLLPVVWALLNNTGSVYQCSTSSAILNAVISHSMKTSSKSALKRLTIEFVARLVLLSTDPRYHGHFQLNNDLTGVAKVHEWVSHLPQPLWEIGASNLPASEIITRFLLRILQQKSQAVHVSTTITALRAKLVPFFTVNHAVRGQLPGPYNKIPIGSPLRRLTLDLAATLLSATDAGIGGELRVAVDLAVVGSEEQEYWVQIQDIAVK
ncbi:Testis-expressed sequence 10 like protein [Termitomyces sp. T112]|nr:Testis-expressed sequence 10 like protein [Termitomyces sp. T112]